MQRPYRRSVLGMFKEQQGGLTSWLDENKVEGVRAEEMRKVGRNIIIQGLIEYGMIIGSG